MKKYIYLIIFVFVSQLAIAQTTSDTIKDLQNKVEYLEKKLVDTDKNYETLLSNIGWAMGSTFAIITIIVGLLGVLLPFLQNKEAKKELARKILVQEQKFKEEVQAQRKEFDERIKKHDIEIGNIKNIIKKDKEQVQEAAKAIEINKLFAKAYNEKDVNKQIELYTEVIRLNPTLAEPYNNRGCAYLKKGELEKAEFDITRAINLDSSIPEFYESNAELLEKYAEKETDNDKKKKCLELAEKDKEESKRLREKYNKDKKDI